MPHCRVEVGTLRWQIQFFLSCRYHVDVTRIDWDEIRFSYGSRDALWDDGTGDDKRV